MLEHKACYVTCPKSWITRENSFELCNLSEHLTVDTLSRTQSLCAWCQKSDSGPSSYFLSLTASQRNLPLLYGWMLTENWSRFCSHGKKKIPKGQVLSKFSSSSLSIFVAFCSFWRYTKYTDQKTFSCSDVFYSSSACNIFGKCGDFLEFWVQNIVLKPLTAWIV